jgi:hypothetical protein
VREPAGAAEAVVHADDDDALLRELVPSVSAPNAPMAWPTRKALPWIQTITGSLAPALAFAGRTTLR